MAFARSFLKKAPKPDTTLTWVCTYGLPPGNGKFSAKMARPERFELPTLWFEARCSDPLSYGRVNGVDYSNVPAWAHGAIELA
jgi:hypothetical protein